MVAVIALLLAIVGALLALTIHVTMPTFGLMVVRLVAAELSAYLVLLEIVAIVRDDGSELAIHAMKMRTKYQRLLPGG